MIFFRKLCFMCCCSGAVRVAGQTNNVTERGAKAAKRHQAVSGYWHSLLTLARWCRLRSYLDSAAAHGITALDAIRTALEGKSWLPPSRPWPEGRSRITCEPARSLAEREGPSLNITRN